MAAIVDQDGNLFGRSVSLYLAVASALFAAGEGLGILKLDAGQTASLMAVITTVLFLVTNSHANAITANKNAAAEASNTAEAAAAAVGVSTTPEI